MMVLLFVIALALKLDSLRHLKSKVKGAIMLCKKDLNVCSLRLHSFIHYSSLKSCWVTHVFIIDRYANSPLRHNHCCEGQISIASNKIMVLRKVLVGSFRVAGKALELHMAAMNIAFQLKIPGGLSFWSLFLKIFYKLPVVAFWEKKWFFAISFYL